jgi:hypothetical protein
MKFFVTILTSTLSFTLLLKVYDTNTIRVDFNKNLFKMNLAIEKFKPKTYYLGRFFKLKNDKRKFSKNYFVISGNTRIEFNKVLCIDVFGHGERYQLYRTNAQKNASSLPSLDIINFTTILPEKEVNSIFETFLNEENFGEYPAACFEPKLALIFYNNNRFVLEINVCLDCNGIRSSSYIKEIDTDFGFNKEGKRKIIEFCKKLNLKYGRRSI